MAQSDQTRRMGQPWQPGQPTQARELVGAPPPVPPGQAPLPPQPQAAPQPGALRPQPPQPPVQQPPQQPHPLSTDPNVMAGRIEGLRAWLAALDRIIGIRTRVLLVLAAIAIGASGAAIYLALEAGSDKASTADLDQLRRDVGAGPAGGSAGLEARLEAAEEDAAAAQAEVDALQTEVDALRAETGSSAGAGTGSPDDASSDTGGSTGGAASGSTGGADTSDDTGANDVTPGGTGPSVDGSSIEP